MNFPVMSTHTMWWRTLCTVSSVRNQLVQTARVTSCSSSSKQALRRRTCNKQEQTSRFHRDILPFADVCGYLVRKVHLTGLDLGVHVKSNTPIKMEADQMRTSQNILEPIKVSLLQEKYHTIRTPRLFHLERQGFQQVAILPLYNTSMESATTSNALELIKNISRGSVVRKQSLTKCLLTLYHLPNKDLREIAQGDQFSSLMSKMVRICTDLSDDDFENFIVNLATLQFKINLCKMSKSANYCAHVFVNESLRRCERWPLKVLLKLCDAFTLMGLKGNALHDKLFQLVEENIDELTICDILQTFYLIGENRRAPQNLVAVLESRMLDFVIGKEISLVEVSTVCTALFKSKSSISSVDVMDALRDFIFASDLPKCPSYHVVGILKVFRQNYYGYSTLFETVGNQVCREMCRYPIQSIMHIVLTFATLHILHEDLMESAANEIINKIDQCRSKDVAKLLWSFATLNYSPSDDKVVFGALLHRVEELMSEMEKYPVFLISSLLSLAYMNIYPSHLIEVVFSSQFLSHIKAYEEREGIDLRRDLFLLDSCVSLECEVKRVNTLKLDYLINRPFSSHMLWDTNKELEHRPELREVVDCIRDLVGGDDYFRVHYVLPYMKTADIEICLDANNKPVAFGNSWEGLQQNKQKTKCNSSVHLSDSIISKITGGTSKRGEDVKRNREQLKAVSSSNEDKYKEEGKITCRNYTSDEERRLQQVQLPQPLLVNHQERRVLIEVSSRNHHHFGAKQLLGLHSMKRRHLTKLGYQVIDVPYYDWELVGRNGSEQRKIYLKNKIFRGTERFSTKED